MSCYILWNLYTGESTSCLLVNTFDGDCFALVGALQYCRIMHNQGLMRERQRGLIIFHLSHSIMGRGSSAVAIVYSIRRGKGTAWLREIQCVPLLLNQT